MILKKGSLLKVIGRGYTDLTAALLAVATKATELQIWKEVDGIFTADPHKVAKARLLQSITPEEAAELTYYGSEVIHPFTMDQVIRASIPIRILNAFKSEGYEILIFYYFRLGTLILPDNLSLDTLQVSSPLPSPTLKHPTAVTIKDNVTILNVHSNKKSVSHGFFSHIFQTLDTFGVIVDLISTSEVHISMALNPSVSEDVIQSAIIELEKRGTVQ